VSDSVRDLYATVQIKDEASPSLDNLDEGMESLLKSLLDTNKEMLEFAKDQSIARKETEKTTKSVGDMLKALGGLAIVGKMKDFAMASLDAYTELEKQKNMAQNLAGDGYGAIQNAMNNTIALSKGISSEGELLTATNAALKYGASIEFVGESMTGLQQLSSITGEDIATTMQKAQESITSGRVGFLKSNAIFADSIESFKAIGSGFDEISKKKREALLLNVLQEKSNDLQNQYNIYAESSAGLQARLNTATGDFQENLGAVIAKGFVPLLKLFLPLIEYFTDAEKGAGRLQIALLALAPVIGTILVGALYSVATAGWAMIAPFLPFIAIAALVGAAIAGIVLVIDDLLTWMDGGESVIGDFFGPFVDLKDKIKSGVEAGFNFIKKSFNSLIDFAKKYGKYLIMAMFPISALFFYWDEINSFLGGIPDKVLEKFKELGSDIKNFVKDLLPDWAVKLIASTGGGGGETSSSVTKVNDAIITKTGEVVQTHPDDNIFITKSSQGFASPGSGISGSSKSGGIQIQSLVGNITIQVTGGTEAGEAIKNAVMSALDDLSNNIYRNQLGLQPA